LFSDDVNGRKSGDSFSARNKAVLEAKIAMGWRPSLPGEAGFLKALLRVLSVTEEHDNCQHTQEKPQEAHLPSQLSVFPSSKRPQPATSPVQLQVAKRVLT